jgi:hypothetical protein
MSRRFVFVSFLGLLALALAGCAGYKLGPIKPTRLKDVSTICVQNVKNQTLEPQVETLLANSIIKQFQQDGTYKMVREKDADAILEFELQQLDRRPARNANGNVLLTREYTLNLRGRYKLTRKSTGELLDSRNITGQTSFFTSGSSLIQADVNEDERQAIPLAAEDLAVRMVAQLSEGW